MTGTLRKSNLEVNISSKFHRLHIFYGKVRYAFLVVFALTIIFSSVISHRVYGESVVGTVVTKIVLEIDGKTSDIVTTQNTIEGALKQNDIFLAKNDITNPPLETYLTGKELDVRVVRAVPVLISDNGQSWQASSAYTQPYDILKQLDVEIFPEDRVTAELIIDPAAEGTVGQKMVIERAPVYTIFVDDTTKIVRSWATNVSELLAEKSISLGVNDIVEPGKSTLLAGISEITVTRINYADVEEEESIEYATKTQYDFNMYRGQSRVVQAGVKGLKTVNYHIVYKNGVEISRTVTSSEVVSGPTTMIIAKGAIPLDDVKGWWPTIVSAGNRYGVDPIKLYDVMMCESHGNQYSGTTYKGLFQYLQSTWDGASYQAGYGGRLITDGNAQIYVTAWKVAKYGWGAWPYCSSIN